MPQPVGGTTLAPGQRNAGPRRGGICLFSEQHLEELWRHSRQEGPELLGF